MPDGKGQRARDEAIARARKGGHNSDLWADSEWQELMWVSIVLCRQYFEDLVLTIRPGTDVMKGMAENWNKWVANVEGHHLEI